MQMLLNYWRRQSRCEVFQVNVGTSGVINIGPSPDRWMLWISQIAGTPQYWRPAIPIGTGPVLCIAQNSQGLLITEDMHGELVRMPWSGTVSSGSQSPWVICAEYSTNAKEEMDRVIRGFISEYITP